MAMPSAAARPELLGILLLVLCGALVLPDAAAAQSAGAPKRWEPISNPGFDPPVGGAKDLVVDPLRNRALVYTRDAIWALDLSTGEWSSFVPVGHPPLVRLALNFPTERTVFDPVQDRLYLTYGRETVFQRDYQAHTSVLRFEDRFTPTWAQATPSGSSGPWNRAPVVIDVANRRLLSFGGLLGAATKDDTRTFSLAPITTWVNAAVGVRPGARMDATACFDATRSRMWMWGGTQADGSALPGESPGTLWAYVHEAVEPWTVIASSGPPHAPTSGLITHDPLRDRLLCVAPDEGRARDRRARGLWSFAISPDGQSGTWSLTTSAADELPAGLPSAQTYDAKGDRLLALFGTRMWSLRLSLPDPPAEAPAPDPSPLVVRPKRDGGFEVGFTLRVATEVRLDVHDVRGRRFASLSPGRLGPGRVDLSVPLFAKRPAGVYFVRTTMDGNPHTARTTRVVLL